MKMYTKKDEDVRYAASNQKFESQHGLQHFNLLVRKETEGTSLQIISLISYVKLQLKLPSEPLVHLYTYETSLILSPPKCMRQMLLCKGANPKAEENNMTGTKYN
ncbi:hypothetical protein TNCT_689791, partial [Trichonephila clavata]